ncbi:MAG: BON domain-containing protein [Phycisphaerales bacterium]|nr:BON domain-containing protein [Phycisphaerales bacterium]
MNQYQREQYEYEQQRRRNYGRYDDSIHDHFGQSHYIPRQPQRDERFRAGLTPGYQDNYHDERFQQGGFAHPNDQRERGAYENWTPQYQNLSNLDLPYDQRRADAYQSASYNPRRAEYDHADGYIQQQRGYAQPPESSQRYDPNRYSNPYGNPYPHNSPYRGQMAGENLPQGMTQREFGYSWYGNMPYGQANERGAYGHPTTRYTQPGRTASQPYAGRGPKGYKRSDDRIKEDVSDALMHAGHIDPSDIEVSVSGGEVTLKGEVCCREDKRQVEDIAERVLGVHDVHTQLHIKQHMDNGDNTSRHAQARSSGQSDETSSRVGAASQKEPKFSSSGSTR